MPPGDLVESGRCPGDIGSLWRARGAALYGPSGDFRRTSLSRPGFDCAAELLYGLARRTPSRQVEDSAPCGRGRAERRVPGPAWTQPHCDPRRGARERCGPPQPRIRAGAASHGRSRSAESRRRTPSRFGGSGGKGVRPRAMSSFVVAVSLAGEPELRTPLGNGDTPSLPEPLPGGSDGRQVIGAPVA